jgi:pSer/pThr/pTyr-binding forkhead associated (FHA) protein
MQWRLHDGRFDHPLDEGQHIIGRSLECSIIVEDARASRQHAALVVEGDTVLVRDLGSRNGVFVAFKRVGATPVPVTAGETIRIGTTSLRLSRGSGQRKTTVRVPADALAALTTAGSRSNRWLAQADQFLADGDGAKFAHATKQLLKSLRAALRSGIRVDEHAVQSATRHALALAERDSSAWLDEIIGLYEVEPIAIPVQVLASLECALERGDWRSNRLESYLERLRPALANAGPRDRALLTQLEVLNRKQKLGQG